MGVGGTRAVQHELVLRVADVDASVVGRAAVGAGSRAPRRRDVAALLLLVRAEAVGEVVGGVVAAVISLGACADELWRVVSVRGELRGGG